jgi:hypothetical protein
MTVIGPLSKAPAPLASPPIPTSPVTFTQSGSNAPPTPLFATANGGGRERKPEEVKVLLAEDNALIREIVTKTLRKMKVRLPSFLLPLSTLYWLSLFSQFSVFAVNDGRECVEQVEKDQYDVILMDVRSLSLSFLPTAFFTHPSSFHRVKCPSWTATPLPPPFASTPTLESATFA